MNIVTRVFELRRTAVRWLIERVAPGPPKASPRRRKVIEWMARYGFAECAGIACAFIASLLVKEITGNSIAAAYGAAWGESLGYSCVIVARDFLSESRAARAANERLSARRAGGVVRGLVAEFGPAALIDTFVTRPLAMGLGVRFLGVKLGIVAGKAAADVMFYVPVIVVYERRMRRNASSPPRA